nr:hypothetical protein [bacterium]
GGGLPARHRKRQESPGQKAIGQPGFRPSPLGLLGKRPVPRREEAVRWALTCTGPVVMQPLGIKRWMHVESRCGRERPGCLRESLGVFAMYAWAESGAWRHPAKAVGGERRMARLLQQPNAHGVAGRHDKIAVG